MTRNAERAFLEVSHCHPLPSDDVYVSSEPSSIAADNHTLQATETKCTMHDATSVWLLARITESLLCPAPSDNQDLVDLPPPSGS